MNSKAAFLSLLRIFALTVVLFALCNLAFWAAQPHGLEILGRFSLYNTIYPGRSRLPYGENIAAAHNLTLNNIPAMLASHEISRHRAADEFRVLVLGDSGTWGWLQQPDETIVARLNENNVRLTDGRRVVFYNLGYPVLSLTKDVLLLSEGSQFNPDLIVWLITLESLALDIQEHHPLVLKNGRRMADLGLPLAASEPQPWWADTIIGRRRELADLMRLQLVGGAWAATGVDQHIPAEYERRKNDFDQELTWHGLNPSQELKPEQIAIGRLQAGIDLAPVPVVIVNEPIYVANGLNSALRYNSFYPRWVYDQYRSLLAAEFQGTNVVVLDYWNLVPPAEFTDSPVHLTPTGAQTLANQLIIDLFNNE